MRVRHVPIMAAAFFGMRLSRGLALALASMVMIVTVGVSVRSGRSVSMVMAVPVVHPLMKRNHERVCQHKG